MATANLGKTTENTTWGPNIDDLRAERKENFADQEIEVQDVEEHISAIRTKPSGRPMWRGSPEKKTAEEVGKWK